MIQDYTDLDHYMGGKEFIVIEGRVHSSNRHCAYNSTLGTLALNSYYRSSQELTELYSKTDKED